MNMDLLKRVGTCTAWLAGIGAFYAGVYYWVMLP
jgi:hypothetical protein